MEQVAIIVQMKTKPNVKVVSVVAQQQRIKCLDHIHLFQQYSKLPQQLTHVGIIKMNSWMTSRIVGIVSILIQTTKQTHGVT
jgi:hypothetical protein